MTVQSLFARYGAKAGIGLLIVGGILLTRDSLPGGFASHSTVTRGILLLAALLFAARLVLVALDPEGAVDLGMNPPLWNTEVTVETRGDLWKPVAFDLVAIVVCLALAVLLPSVPTR